MRPAEPTPQAPRGRRAVPPAAPASGPYCVQCGSPVPDRSLGCRWPCENCGFLYPQGDCSD